MPDGGDRVRVPNPAGDGEVVATFLRPGYPSDAIDVDGRKVDVGWVRYEDGELEGATGKVPYRDIKPA
jgi:hypothetical protein